MWSAPHCAATSRRYRCSGGGGPAHAQLRALQRVLSRPAPRKITSQPLACRGLISSEMSPGPYLRELFSWPSVMTTRMADYFKRTGTARSNMFDNRPNETQCFYTDNDASGAPLDGSKIYAITFPAGQEPPVNGFWSLTLYNQHHFFSPNTLKRYSLGTKNEGLKRNQDGSLTLYAGAVSPGKGKESNWLPAPKEPFSAQVTP